MTFCIPMAYHAKVVVIGRRVSMSPRTRVISVAVHGDGRRDGVILPPVPTSKPLTVDSMHLVSRDLETEVLVGTQLDHYIIDARVL